jgi:hypothetical protein
MTVSLYFLLWAKRELNEEAAMAASIRNVSVAIPEGTPEISQENIDIAMTLYSIDVGPNTELPIFDSKLEDRGLTSRGALSARSAVTVGPAAFSTWAILGSTLAHEIEIHGRQNFLIISIMDMFRLDGTGMAERQAYSHELAGSARFGMDSADENMIRETMEYYYPEKRSVLSEKQLSARVQKWFSRNILRERGIL